MGRHITPADLPPPTHAENDPEAPDFERMAMVVEAPQGTMPEVPEGFAIQLFASGLNEPRVIRIAPNGDIFVAESGSGRVLVFAADSAGAAPAEPEIFADGLDRPFGIAFYPPAKPSYVYVGTADQVVRFPYRDGDRCTVSSGPGHACRVSSSQRMDAGSPHRVFVLQTGLAHEETSLGQCCCWRVRLRPFRRRAKRPPIGYTERVRLRASHAQAPDRLGRLE